jgi:hypothetical protein
MLQSLVPSLGVIIGHASKHDEVATRPCGTLTYPARAAAAHAESNVR